MANFSKTPKALARKLRGQGIALETALRDERKADNWHELRELQDETARMHSNVMRTIAEIGELE